MQQNVTHHGCEVAVAPEWSGIHLAQRLKSSPRCYGRRATLEMTCTTLRFGRSSRQLYFRKKSSDEAVMKQIFVNQQYNLNRIGDALS
jgi:hypothetical protein